MELTSAGELWDSDRLTAVQPERPEHPEMEVGLPLPVVLRDVCQISGPTWRCRNGAI